MRWLKPNLRSSIYSLLGSPAAPTESRLERGVEDIRLAMLDMLGAGDAQRFPQLLRRVRYADDVQGLWYLRGELMAAMASVYGELGARERVAGLTSMFEGLLPAALSSRPSRLMG